MSEPRQQPPSGAPPGDPRPSLRRPWVRAGLSPLVVLALPFVWVVETQSCGPAPVTEEYRGLDLVAHLQLRETPALALVALAMLLAPWLARRFRPLGSLVVQVLGLAVTVFWAWIVWVVLFFTLFATRLPRPAGVVVLLTTLGMVVDALARVMLSVREWWRSRRAP